MNINARELRARRAELLDKAAGMIKDAELTDRDFTAEEAGQYDGLIAEADSLEARALRLEQMGGLQPAEQTVTRRQAPAVLSIPRGDNETRALAHFFRTGRAEHLGDLRQQDEFGQYGLTINLPRERRAVVDSTMNITTAADGGYLVPTGFASRVAARMTEIRLADRLRLTRVTGRGTTVNFPFQNADPQVFAATSEQADDLSTNDYERDALVIGQKAFTLAKKTKKLQLTEELLDDEDVNILDFIGGSIGKSVGLTHNAMLITELAANGSTLKTFASATAIAAGEPEDIVFGSTIAYYLDDAGSVGWVMRPSTFGDIASITGNARLYAETPGGSFSREILGYPVFYSNAVAATAASAKDVYFGNWSYVGFREDPALRIIMDPYSEDGVLVLKYSFRAVYGVLIAGAVGFGVHPSS